MSLTLQGRVYYRRAYYGCPHCHQGHYPLDRRLGIQPGEMSAEVIRLAALAGVQDAFDASSEWLAQAALLELSPNSIRKACQQVGEAIMRQEQALIDQSQDLAHPLERKRDADKPQRLDGSLDGFYILLEDGWRQMKGGVWWQIDGQGKTCQAHYYADTAPGDTFADLVWATGFEHQADQVSELIFVADGVEWVWNIVQQHYPQAVQIVDWFHACQYLSPVAAAAFKDPLERPTWLETVKTLLWEGELDAVIAACAQLVNPALSREDDPAQQAVSYYTHNRQRMDYPAFRAKGYQIGSGVMESGCQQIGLERLKIAGARWSEAGARKVAKARAAYLSRRWHQLTPPSRALPQVA